MAVFDPVVESRKCDRIISVQTLYWLLLSQLFIVLGHFFHLPLLVVLAWLLAVCWRLGMSRSLWGMPNALIKIGLLVMLLVGIGSGYDKLLGLEPATALLIGAFGLKLVELRTQRDVYLLILLGYFVIVSRFLFSQSIPVTLYLCFCTLLVTTTLVSQQSGLLPQGLKGDGRQGRVNLSFEPFRLAFKMLMQAFPLLVVFFLVFPRISPFWSVPAPMSVSKTGVSDTLSVGSMVKLTRSSELAFRVTFETEQSSDRTVVLPQSMMYWRGLVLSEFDGTRWRQSESDRSTRATSSWSSAVVPEEGVKYRVIMEPTQRHWLFALPVANAFASKAAGLRRSLAGDIMSVKPLRQRMEFSVQSQLQTFFDGKQIVSPTLRTPSGSKSGFVLNTDDRVRNLALPHAGNPQARALALRWRDESENDEALLALGLSHFREQPFFYTLEPPALKGQFIDDFLFRTRSGFCEHYANAFAFMMRSAGIPTRIASGYQGGELNPYAAFVQVRQYDAHAWVEVWLSDYGWVRVDPTAMVAPERVSISSIEAFQNDPGFLSGSVSAQWYKLNRRWFAFAQQRYNQVNYLWHSSVLNFDRDTQASTLKRLLGGADPWRIGALMLAGLLVVIAPIWLTIVIRERRVYRNKADQYFFRFVKKCAKQGYDRRPGETAMQYAARLSLAFPDSAAQIRQISCLYSDLVYQAQEGADQKQALGAFRKDIALFRLK
jgi:transglutaminase-like putative cysteine protease